jgi:hypothetical protein
VVDDAAPDELALVRLLEVPGLESLLREFLPDLAEVEETFGAELILEGLHQHSVLAKEVSEDATQFTDMVSRMFEDFGEGRPRRRRRG